MKFTIQTAFPLAVVAIVAGCSYPTAERSVSPQQIEREDTRLVGYMQYGRTTSVEEQTPGQISRDAVANEAILYALEDGQTCIELTIRTNAERDEPLAVYELTLDGRRVHPGDEQIEVVDYTYTGERDVLVAEGITGEAFAQLRLTEPEERVYRVFERRTELCGPISQTGDIELEVVAPNGATTSQWGQSFVWTLY